MVYHTFKKRAHGNPEIRAILEHQASLNYKDDYEKLLAYVDPRGIPPMLVEETIKSAQTVPGKYPGTWDYKADGFKVVVNKK